MMKRNTIQRALVLEAVNRLINPYTRDLTLEDMDILQP